MQFVDLNLIYRMKRIGEWVKSEAIAMAIFVVDLFVLTHALDGLALLVVFQF